MHHLILIAVCLLLVRAKDLCGLKRFQHDDKHCLLVNLTLALLYNEGLRATDTGGATYGSSNDILSPARRHPRSVCRPRLLMITS